MNNQTISQKNTCNDPLALCDTSNKDKFWLDDPTVLYTNSNYTKIIPKYEMTRNQQLNSITRFCIYMIILILAFNRGEYILILPIAILIVVILFKKFNNNDLYGGAKEISKILNIRQEKENHQNALIKREYSQDGSPKLKTPIEMEDEEEKNKDYIIKSGKYSSDNKLSLGTKEKPSEYLRERNESLYTIDELADYEKNTCRKPTNDNPMMNPAITEFGAGDPPAACNADDDDIKESIKVNFNHQLFRDVDELWERENSQRQFYTMPNTTIPNNQNEFASWLYKLPSSQNCKEDNSGCLRYSDIRFRSR